MSGPMLWVETAGEDEEPLYMRGLCPNCGPDTPLVPDPDPRANGGMTCPRCGFCTNVRPAGVQ